MARIRLTPSQPSAAAPPRVIVTYGRSLMSLVIAHSLGKRGIEVIGCDDVELTVLSFSRFVKRSFVHAPLAEPYRFLDDLESKVRKFKPDDDRPYILMPVFRETELISEHRQRFQPFINVAVPDHDAIRRVHPKDHLAEIAESLALPIPRTVRVYSALGTASIPADMGFPVLIKPPDETGGRGIEQCRSVHELCERLNRYPFQRYGSALVQEIIPGDDYCLTVLFEHG